MWALLVLLSTVSSESDEVIPSVCLEYQITVPVDVNDFQIGHLYTVGEFSKANTGGGDGVEVITNEPRDKGIDGIGKHQFTNKFIHLKSKVPKFITLLAPKGSLEVEELSYNAHPDIVTLYKNPYMKNNFQLKVTTINKPGAATIENVHNLSGERLAKRVIDKIDIVNDRPQPADYQEEYDPKKCAHGPLNENWQESSPTLMTSYKLVELSFKWWGLQTKVEGVITRGLRRVLLNFFRQMYCTQHEWKDMTIADIREMEAKIKQELDNMREKGIVKGIIEH